MSQEALAALEITRPEATRRTTRGARRLLRALGYSVLAEMPLPCGGRADLVALASDGRVRIVEVKSSLADFRADLKWRRYRMHCDQLYFATPPDIPESALPQDAGLIVADAHGGMLLRDAPEHRLAPATRRSMMIRFGSIASERLCDRLYPEDFLH